MSIVVLCDDLIFASKVTATAKAYEMQAVMIRTAGKAIDKVRESSPKCVIVDLNLPGLDLVQFYQELHATGLTPNLVGFGSHVQADVLELAKQLGFQFVMPRSQFHRRLETELPLWSKADHSEQQPSKSSDG